MQKLTTLAAIHFPAIKLTERNKITLPTEIKTFCGVLQHPNSINPKTIDNKIHAAVSSIIPAAIVICPKSLLIRFKSINTFAITGIAETEIAVARNNEKTIRCVGSTRKISGNEKAKSKSKY